MPLSRSVQTFTTIHAALRDLLATMLLGAGCAALLAASGVDGRESARGRLLGATVDCLREL